MALPTPRSYQQILGEMLQSFVTDTGYQNFRIGGPLLSLMESAAQSDMRSTQDIFGMLDSSELDRATGISLDRIGQSESVARFVASPATGYVKITDSSFTKLSTNLYSGTLAPPAGALYLNVSDATDWPSSGSLYVGRGTANFEGPLPFTVVTQIGSYWRITLSSPTTKFHNTNESVILSRGGERVLAAGLTVKTPSSGAQESVQFLTRTQHVLEDGETEISGILVTAAAPGVIGNVPSGGITAFGSEPFSGAVVTNTSPFTNGSETESDNEYRERIRDTRASRAKATPLAIRTAILGTDAPDESARVVSASVVSETGKPTSVYIDNGLGYEQVDVGVPYDPLVSSALGGEQLFQLASPRPISKAFLKTGVVAPFALRSGDELAIKVGGALYTHTFSVEDFKDIANATAYEVVASINGDNTLPYAARTTDGATGVKIFAKEDTQEDLDIQVPTDATDANDALDFQTGRIDTLKLYKNDRLLYKDGQAARVFSAPKGTWGAISSGASLSVAVDGITVGAAITDADFVAVGLGPTTVDSANSLSSWAAVINSKIPGVTCSVQDDRLVLSSNRGTSSSASVEILACDLVTAGMWTDEEGLSATGKDADYTFNRFLGQGRLAVPLEEGDILTAGTAAATAYVQTVDLNGSVTIGTSTFYLVLDGDPEIIATGLNAGSSVAISAQTATYGALTINYRRYTVSAGVFSDVQVGDWMIVWDDAFKTKGCWPVVKVDAAGAYVDIQADHGTETQSPTQNGIVFVRTRNDIQEIVAVAGTYNADQLAAHLATKIVGATVSTQNNDAVRIATNTYRDNGSIMVVTADVNAQELGFETGVLIQNESVHYANAETTYRDGAVTSFQHEQVGTVGGGAIQPVGSLSVTGGDQIAWLRPWENSPALRWGNNRDRITDINSIAGTSLYYRDTNSTVAPLVGDRFYLAQPMALGHNETLGVVLDNDSVNKNYQIPLYRTIRPVAGEVYGSTFAVMDMDNGSADLSDLFGTTFDFTDFCLYGRARGKAHESSGLNKSILWRSGRYGKENEQFLLTYSPPVAANQSAQVEITLQEISHLTGSDGYPVLHIRLPSGGARSVPTLHQRSKFVSTVSLDRTNPGNGIDVYTVRITEATLTCASGKANRDSSGNTSFTDFTPPINVSVGDIVWIESGDPNFPSGPKIVTGAALPGTSFSYQESLPMAVSGVPITVRFAPTALDLTSVVVNDIVSIGGTLPADHHGQWSVSAKGANWFEFETNSNVAAMTSPQALGGTSYLSFFPITPTTASDLASAVSGDFPNLITGVPVEDGGGLPGTANITQPMHTEWLLDALADWQFYWYDSVNWIADSDLTVSPNTITLKEAIEGSLGINSDFDNETFYLVPRHTQTLARWLNSPAVTGLAGGGSVLATSNNRKLQLGTQTPGSAGAVQVSGGTANSVSVPVQGASIGEGQVTKMLVAADQAGGLVGGAYARIRATAKTVKPVELSVGETVTISGTGPYTITTSATKLYESLWKQTNTVTWNVEKHGDFVVLSVRDGGTAPAPALPATIINGAWLYLNAADASSANKGWFRIVGYSQTMKSFWIENVNAVEESFLVKNTDTLRVLDFDKAVYGDYFEIPDNSLGANNKGLWQITGLGATEWSVTVTGTGLSAAGPTTLTASNYQLFRLREGEAPSFVCHLDAIFQAAEGEEWLNVTVPDADLAPWISEARGSVIEPLGKLGFPTSLSRGGDGYAYTGGLIGEVAKILYGDESDTATYPGVVAAGAEVDVKGPIIKRVSVSLLLRLWSGVDPTTTVNAVKSAVAATINSTPLGQPIAISDVVEAANRVNGVLSVVVTSPLYSTGNDLISVQDYEKPFVLDVDEDVTVQIVGG